MLQDEDQDDNLRFALLSRTRLAKGSLVLPHVNAGVEKVLDTCGEHQIKGRTACMTVR